MDKPIYQTLVETLIEEIDQASPNSPVSSERELAERFQVSRMTARRALKELVLLGYVYTNKTKGTFVADKKLRKREGPKVLTVSENNYNILYFDIKSNDERVQQKLGLSNFDSYARIVKANNIDGVHSSIDEIYINTKYLSAEKIEAMDFLQTFSNNADKLVGTRSFKAVIVPAKYAKMLDLSIETPIIQMESVYLTNQGAPHVFCITYNHPELAKVKLNI
ncbi:MAG: GntR family transcriptional regulator [Lachnospiraceae bacterium]